MMMNVVAEIVVGTVVVVVDDDDYDYVDDVIVDVALMYYVVE
jgi:hypothetical protein